jgi:hypothetical protein
MKALQQLAILSALQGMKRGESAKDFAKRNPEGAAKIVAFMREHSDELMLDIAESMLNERS